MKAIDIYEKEGGQEMPDPTVSYPNYILWHNEYLRWLEEKVEKQEINNNINYAKIITDFLKQVKYRGVKIFTNDWIRKVVNEYDNKLLREKYLNK
ncbi:MAG: hypothetical protein ACOCVF_01140 [bacterium]